MRKSSTKQKLIFPRNPVLSNLPRGQEYRTISNPSAVYASPDLVMALVRMVSLIISSPNFIKEYILLFVCFPVKLP